MNFAWPKWLFLELSVLEPCDDPVVSVVEEVEFLDRPFPGLWFSSLSTGQAEFLNRISGGIRDVGSVMRILGAACPMELRLLTNGGLPVTGRRSGLLGCVS